jgi:drug/metabolite transporter (DMT)-like permease
MMWAFLLLGERPEKSAIIGGVFICIAVIMLSLEPLFYCRSNK